MKVNEIAIKANSTTIEASLTITIPLEYNNESEMPLSITGELLSADGKILAYPNEHQINTERELSITMSRDGSRDNRLINYTIESVCFLSKAAISHIEEQRSKDVDHSAAFIVKLIKKALKTRPSGINHILELEQSLETKKYEIKQSEWVRYYAPILEIGNYLLVELFIPEDVKAPKPWDKLYKNLCANLIDMEACLRNGDWEKTMFKARMFYENIKIGDGKPGHEKFKVELKKILQKEQHSDEGIQNLLDAIWKMFDFVSKYIHEKDRAGNIMPQATISKEDAYFAYTLAIGLLNLIGKKISK